MLKRADKKKPTHKEQLERCGHGKFEDTKER
jgi:hypothetical protein